MRTCCAYQHLDLERTFFTGEMGMVDRNVELINEGTSCNADLTPVQIDQVVMNLVTDAVHAMASKAGARERSGHAVTALVSSQEARKWLRTTDAKVDVVISDYNMPGDNGIEVLKDVMCLKPGTPVALISGYITDAMREEAAKVGVNEIIFKPNSPQELAQAMHRLLQLD